MKKRYFVYAAIIILLLCSTVRLNNTNFHHNTSTTTVLVDSSEEFQPTQNTTLGDIFRFYDSEEFEKLPASDKEKLDHTPFHHTPKQIEFKKNGKWIWE